MVARTPGPRSTLLAAVLAGLLVAAAGCGGSAIDPEVANAANDGVHRQTSQAANAPGTSTAEQPGAVPGPGTALPGSPTTDQPGTPGSAPGPGGDGGPDAPPSVRTADCDGFKNTTGITDSTITIGNAADLSGPIPGLFTSAQQATKAYVAYFNATSSICGRKLELKLYDSRTDAGADQNAYTKMCTETFAAVGSMSAFDSGGARPAAGCGLPDIRTAAVTADRNSCSTCFGTQALGAHEFTNIAKPYVQYFPDAARKAAFLYLNAGAAAENAKTLITLSERLGMKYLYTSPIDVADFNYGPYVQQMKQRGVQMVQFIGAYQQTIRLAQAMQSAGFKPQVFAADPSVYDQNFVKTGGAAVDGALIYVNFAPFEDPVPEQTLYLRWLQQVAPGAQPSFFGIYAWSAAKLFVEESLGLGGQLSRANLVAKTRTQKAWTGGGLHAAMQVGPKHAPSCIRFLRLTDGKWVPFKGTRYVCVGYSKA